MLLRHLLLREVFKLLRVSISRWFHSIYGNVLGSPDEFLHFLLIIFIVVVVVLGCVHYFVLLGVDVTLLSGSIAWVGDSSCSTVDQRVTRRAADHLFVLSSHWLQVKPFDKVLGPLATVNRLRFARANRRHQVDNSIATIVISVLATRREAGALWEDTHVLVLTALQDRFHTLALSWNLLLWHNLTRTPPWSRSIESIWPAAWTHMLVLFINSRNHLLVLFEFPRVRSWWPGQTFLFSSCGSHAVVSLVGGWKFFLDSSVVHIAQLLHLLLGCRLRVISLAVHNSKLLYSILLATKGLLLGKAGLCWRQVLVGLLSGSCVCEWGGVFLQVVTRSCINRLSHFFLLQLLFILKKKLNSIFS